MVQRKEDLRSRDKICKHEIELEPHYSPQPCDVSMIHTLFTGQLRNLLRDCNRIKFDFNEVISLMWETLLLCNYWKSVKGDYIEAAVVLSSIVKQSSST